MNVLVTGANGFIAKNLIKELASHYDIDKIYAISRHDGVFPFGKDWNKTDEVIVPVQSEIIEDGWLSHLFENIKIDTIFHLAAEQGKTPKAFNANVAMTSNLLKIAPEGCKFVYASSSTVYGNLLDKYEFTKKEGWAGHKCHEESPTIPTNLYGAAKLAGEALVNAYAATGKVQAYILRYVATVGPGANHGVLPDIIKKLREPGEYLHLFGEAPGSVKPYVHVKDIALGTAIVGELEPGIYNLTNIDEASIQDIAEIAMEEMNISKKLVWMGNDYLPMGDNKLVMLDGKKLGDRWMEYRGSEWAIRHAIRDIIKCESS